MRQVHCDLKAHPISVLVFKFMLGLSMNLTLTEAWTCTHQSINNLTWQFFRKHGTKQHEHTINKYMLCVYCCNLYIMSMYNLINMAHDQKYNL